jgi:hypothetical protein
VAQDPDEDVVREVVEAVAATAAAGWSLPRRVLQGHFAERVTCMETAAGVSTQESRTPLARNKERRANRNGLTSNPRTRRGRKGFRDGLASERREERTERAEGLAESPVLGLLRRRSVVPEAAALSSGSCFRWDWREGEIFAGNARCGGCLGRQGPSILTWAGLFDLQSDLNSNHGLALIPRF